MLLLAFLLLVPTQQELQTQTDSYLYLFDYMPAPKVYVLSDDHYPCTEKSVACAFDNKLIFVREGYRNQSSPDELKRTLKHELIHSWLAWKGLRDDETHGTLFKRKATEINLDDARYNLNHVPPCSKEWGGKWNCGEWPIVLGFGMIVVPCVLALLWAWLPEMLDMLGDGLKMRRKA